VWSERPEAGSHQEALEGVEWERATDFGTLARQESKTSRVRARSRNDHSTLQNCVQINGITVSQGGSPADVPDLEHQSSADYMK
jgi:hypothetical protein